MSAHVPKIAPHRVWLSKAELYQRHPIDALEQFGVHRVSLETNTVGGHVVNGVISQRDLTPPPCIHCKAPTVLETQIPEPQIAHRFDIFKCTVCGKTTWIAEKLPLDVC